MEEIAEGEGDGLMASRPPDCCLPLPRSVAKVRANTGPSGEFGFFFLSAIQR